MEWLNLHTSVLDSPAVIGSDPVDRGTWLMLLRYCIGQENGGIIADSKSWKDRKWQQLVRVTAKEIGADSELWKWQGEDLILAHYPIEKETEVKTNRSNGKLGGRPRKETQKKPPGLDSLPTSVSPMETTRPEIAETERKGKERKGKEVPPNPQGGTPEETQNSGGRIADLPSIQKRINGLKPEWGKPATWDYIEEHQLFGGTAAQMEEMTEADWSLLKRFLNARLPQEAGYWQPYTRKKFVETFSDTFTSAQRWQSKQNPPGPSPGQKVIPITPRPIIPRSDLAEVFGNQSATA